MYRDHCYFVRNDLFSEKQIKNSSNSKYIQTMTNFFLESKSYCWILISSRYRWTVWLGRGSLVSLNTLNERFWVFSVFMFWYRVILIFRWNFCMHWQITNLLPSQSFNLAINWVDLSKSRSLRTIASNWCEILQF